MPNYAKSNLTLLIFKAWNLFIYFYTANGLTQNPCVGALQRTNKCFKPADLRILIKHRTPNFKILSLIILTATVDFVKKTLNLIKDSWYTHTRLCVIPMVIPGGKTFVCDTHFRSRRDYDSLPLRVRVCTS